MIFYAIEHITTGNLLPPGGKKLRGHTHQEPSGTRPPRLFETERKAIRCLDLYLQGKWRDGYINTIDGPDYEGPNPDWRTKRNKDEFRVVPLRITKVSD